jgi:hypothetical protein
MIHDGGGCNDLPIRPEGIAPGAAPRDGTPFLLHAV